MTESLESEEVPSRRTETRCGANEREKGMAWAKGGDINSMHTPHSSGAKANAFTQGTLVILLT